MVGEMSVATTRPWRPARHAAASVWPPEPAAMSSTDAPGATPAPSSMRSVASASQLSTVGPQRCQASAASSHCCRVVVLYCNGSKLMASSSRRRGPHPEGARRRPRTARTGLANRQRPREGPERQDVYVDRPSREALIGRDDALARVTHAVASATHHARGTLLVSGAAGMGKTALLRTALAGAGDVDQAWGTCVEAGNAPGYWPWTQALNGLVRGVGIDRARAAAAGDRGLLATISTALGEQGPAEESDRGRLLLLDATAAWLDALAAVRPVVVVLDDLQWLDDSSLALLERVVQDPRPAALCVLGAFRHDEVPRSLQARLTALAARAQHVHLTGLDRSSADLLVQGTVGRPVPEAMTAVIYRRAGGHPLFTRELALAAVDGLPEAQVPAAVREAIGRRLRTLPAETQEVLRGAALIG